VQYEGLYKIEEAQPAVGDWVDYFLVSETGSLHRTLSISVHGPIQLPIGTQIHVRSYGASCRAELPKK
jgi:hypothetical protein